MKNSLSTLFSIILIIEAHAQWVGTNPVYFTAGNVGIGLTNPSAKFHIQQSADGWSDGIRLSLNGKNWDFIVDTNGDRLIVTKDQNISSGFVIKNGNFGVGISSPQYSLDVAGNANMSEGLDVDGAVNFNGGRLTQTGNLPNDNNASFVNTSSTGYGFFSQGGGSGKYAFHLLNQQGTSVLYGDGNGNVGIGTTAPGSFKLAVNGKVWAQEVQVALTNPAPDYVFEPNYKLLSLEEIKSYIDQHKHLPEVPSAKEMETNGVNVSEMNMLLLKKIEELTLHMIELKKELNDLKSNKK